MTFSFFDIIFLVIIAFFAFTAAAHGLIKELFGKLAVIVGIFAAFFFCGQLSPYLKNFIDNPVVDIVLAFLILFIAAFLLVKIVQMILKSVFSGEILKSLDHALGLLFGLVEGLLVVCSVIILLDAQPWFNADSILSKSTIAKFLLPALDRPINYIQGMLA